MPEAVRRAAWKGETCNLWAPPRPLRVPGGSIDLRQVEQDVFIWELRPSLGIQAPCSLAAKGGWAENPARELHRRKYKDTWPIS